jgi:thioredoxin-related protein
VKAFVSIIALTAAFSSLLVGGSRPDKFDPKRDAAKDIAAAVAEAKQTNRRVLLDVGGEWCIWCRRLDTLFVKNPDLGKYLHDNFVVVKVNYSKENKNEKVLSRYPKIQGYPHFFVLDNDGKLLRSQDTGELESGKGHDRDKVLAFLKTWISPVPHH